MSDNARETVNAGVIGAGSMGQNHVRIYNELPGVNLVGVFDVDESRADEVAAEHGTRSLSRNALLQAADAVSVAVPTPYHHETALDCIDAGVNVLVEKPFVSSREEGESLIERAREQDVVIQVGHVERFNPAVAALDDIVSGLDIVAVEAQRLGPPRDRAISDSAVMDLMTHDLDILLSLVDSEVEGVSAVGARNNDHALAQIGFADGTVANLTASRLTQQKIRRLAITAVECWIEVDYISQSVEIHRHSLPEYIATNGDFRYRHESIVERPTVGNGEPLKEELSAFAETAATGGEPRVTAEDGLRVLDLAARIDELAADVTQPTGLEASAEVHTR